MPLAGRQLSYKWALALDHFVGFRGLKLVKSVAVMTAESGRYVGAYNDQNANGSIDRGLFQINSIHGEHSTFDPIANAAYAFKLSAEGSDWSPWVAYGGVNYLASYAIALVVFTAGLWRARVERVGEEFAA